MRKYYRKIMGVTLSSILAIGAIAGTDAPVKYGAVVQAASSQRSSFSGMGQGTLENPYVINTVDQLKEISNNLSAHYCLGSNIDMSGITDWEPIGDGQHAFTGTFNGNGHVIKNLEITVNGRLSDDEIVPENDNLNRYFGIFGYAKNATIKNVGIKNIRYKLSYEEYYGDYNAFSYLGGLVGSARGTQISQCYVTGNLRCVCESKIYARVGGIIGNADTSTTISDCYADVECYGSTIDMNTMVGGIAAWVGNATITKCYTEGKIASYNTNSYAYAGGINGSGQNGNVAGCISMVSSINTTAGYYAIKRDIGYGITETNCKVAEPNTNQTKERSMYTNRGWDLNTVWELEDKVPTLRVFDNPVNISNPSEIVDTSEPAVTNTQIPTLGDVEDTDNNVDEEDGWDMDPIQKPDTSDAEDTDEDMIVDDSDDYNEDGWTDEDEASQTHPVELPTTPVMTTTSSAVTHITASPVMVVTKPAVTYITTPPVMIVTKPAVTHITASPVMIVTKPAVTHITTPAVEDSTPAPNILGTTETGEEQDTQTVQDGTSDLQGATSDRREAQTVTQKQSTENSEAKVTKLEVTSDLDEDESLYVGDSLMVYALVTPEELTETTGITWTSSNTKVAKVSSEGKVVCLGKGNVTITAIANDGSNVSASIKLTVLNTSDLELSGISITNGKMTPKFLRSRKAYSVILGRDTDNTIIKPTAVSSNATVKINGKKVKKIKVVLKKGKSKTVKISVLSSNGASKVYKILVRRKK